MCTVHIILDAGGVKLPAKYKLFYHTNMEFVDLRDLNSQDRIAWRKAIEEQTGLSLEEVIQNSPIMITECDLEDPVTTKMLDGCVMVEVHGVEYWFKPARPK